MRLLLTSLLACSLFLIPAAAKAGEGGGETGIPESAAGQEAAAANSAATPAAAETAGKTAKALGKFDFDFYGEDAPGSPGLKMPLVPPDPDFEARVHRRRWMLKTHQALGLATWALMAATVTIGQLNYNQEYGGGGGSRKWQNTHTYLVIATSAAFLGTASMSILAPKPYPKPLRFDTALLHRIAVAGATLGMLTQVGLGLFTHYRAQAGNPHELHALARTHQIVGYSTFGLLTVAATVWIF
jgi:hypothetical protein